MSRSLLRPVIARWRNRETTIYECRDCGTELDSEDATCHVCGSSDVATFELEL